MAFVIGSENVEFTNFGTSCSVPNHDVSKLSYYLRCGTKSCEVNVIEDWKLLDFKTAHLRKHERQQEILRLAAVVYDIKTLINKTIYLADDNHRLLKNGNSMNEFYKVEKVSSVLAVAREALIAGKQTQVTTIMVCNKRWLNKYYFEPLKRNEARINRLLASQRQSIAAEALAAALLGALAIEEEKERKAIEQSNHCNHCKGLAGGSCACKEGCPPTSQSQCVVVHENVTCDNCREQNMQGARYKCNTCFNYDLCGDCYHNKGAHNKTHPFSRIARVGSTPERLAPRQAESKHCSHCKGLGSICACKEGCPPKHQSECVVVHEGVQCDHCFEKGIHGSRYKCENCTNYDYNLCTQCYRDGAHNKAHPFHRIDRVGSTPLRLPPRQPEVVSPPRAQRVVEKPKDSPRSVMEPPLAKAEVVDVDADVGAARVDVDVVDADSFYPGQDVTLKGLTEARRNGAKAKVIRVVGKRVIVHLVVEDKKVTVPPENLDAVVCLIPLDTIVELQKLKAQAHRNGLLGIVVASSKVSANRVAVQLLDDDSVTLSVKPENCKIIEDC